MRNVRNERIRNGVRRIIVDDIQCGTAVQGGRGWDIYKGDRLMASVARFNYIVGAVNEWLVQK